MILINNKWNKIKYKEILNMMNYKIMIIII